MIVTEWKESVLLKVRADLMGSLRKEIGEQGWTQQQAAERLGVGQSRISDLVRGKWEKFSIDMLITLAARAGGKVKLVFADAAREQHTYLGIARCIARGAGTTTLMGRVVLRIGAGGGERQSPSCPGRPAA